MSEQMRFEKWYTGFLIEKKRAPTLIDTWQAALSATPSCGKYGVIPCPQCKGMGIVSAPPEPVNDGKRYYHSEMGDEVNSLLVVGYGWHQKYEIQGYVVTKEFGLTCYLKEPAAPTPPAVEPVYQIQTFQTNNAYWVDCTVERYQWAVNNGLATRKMYTSPPSSADDELRKAAREAVDVLGTVHTPEAAKAYMALTFALNKGKS